MKSKQKTKVLNMRTLKLLCLVLIAIPGLIWPDNPHGLPEGHVRQADLSGPGPIPVDAFSLSTLADLKFTLNKYTGIKATVELAPENLGWTWGAQNFANCNQSGTAHFFRPVTGFITANELFTQGIRGDVSTCAGEGPGGGPSRYSVDLDGHTYYGYTIESEVSYIKLNEEVTFTAKDATTGEPVQVSWHVEGQPEGATLKVGNMEFSSSATFSASVAETYTITTSAQDHEYSTAAQSATVHVVDIEINGDLLFFRSENLFLNLNLRPNELLNIINVNLSGFDNTHWSAVYNETYRRIDLSNLIEKSSPINWLDHVILNISIQTEDFLGEFILTRRLELKKDLYSLWSSIKDSLINKANDMISPANTVRKEVRDSLLDMTAVDPDNFLHVLPIGSINAAANHVYLETNSLWAELIGYRVWTGAPIENLHSEIVSESWTFDWTLDIKPVVSGGTLTINVLDPMSFPKVDPWEWFKSVNEHGFTPKLFQYEKHTIQFSVNADGMVGEASVETGFNSIFRFENEGFSFSEPKRYFSGFIEFIISVYFKAHF